MSTAEPHLPSSPRGFFARVCVALVGFYQRYLSRLKPPCCRFTPTCSEYSRQAFLVHGFFRGSLLTIWRLLRCQPFYRGAAYDPVPPPRERGKSKQNK